MDTLTFIDPLISALAWPITAVVIFLILRRALLNLFPMIQRMRFQGVELDFTRQVQALAVEAHRDLPILRGVLNSEDQLRNLRNAAAHASDFSFTTDSAIEYADLAMRLTEYLRKT